MTEPRSPAALLGRAIREPRLACQEARAILRGLWYRFWCRLRGTRLRAGRNLRIDGRLVIRGPGSVVIGDNVRIGMTVTPWTYSAEAVISIGSDCFVNGTTFGCQREITIGSRCILGSASIMDTDFHSVSVRRHEPDAPVRVAPVILEENVWICAQAGLLPGTRIGRNSVVGFGAICAGTFPANSVIVGNPARVVETLVE